jgi:hypothetical protein
MEHAPLWNEHTKQLSWMFPVDESYSNHSETLGWIEKKSYKGNDFCVPYCFSHDCQCSMKKD